MPGGGTPELPAVLRRSQTEMWEKRRQLIWHQTLPPSVPLSSRRSASLCHSVSRLIPLYLLALSPFAPNEHPRVFSLPLSLPLSFAVGINVSNCLIPAGERGRQCSERDICECIYMGLRESLLRGQDQPPILCETSSYWHVPERDHQPTTSTRGRGGERRFISETQKSACNV